MNNNARAVINPSLTQYIAVILILVCTFVMISESNKITLAKTSPQEIQKTKKYFADLKKKNIYYEEKLSTKNFLQTGSFEQGVLNSFHTFSKLLQKHDLDLEFEIQGSNAAIQLVLNAIEQQADFPPKTYSFLLKPSNARDLSISARLISDNSMQVVRLAL